MVSSPRSMTLFCRQVIVALLVGLTVVLSSPSKYRFPKLPLDVVTSTERVTKVVDLEGELQSLHEPEENVEFFEELSDVDQQRHKPEDVGEGTEASMTTLIPTTLTEEETRVDEPTERGPTEPTQENGISTLPSATEIDLVASEDLNNFLREDNGSPSPTASVDRTVATETASQELKVISDQSGTKRENNQEEEQQIPPDDLISVTSDETMTSQSEEDREDVIQEWPMRAKDDVTMENDEIVDNISDGQAASRGDEDKAEATRENENSTASDQTKSVVMGTERHQLDNVSIDEELLTRSTRGSRASSSGPRGNEDLLELIIEMAEQPKSWEKISELLGKLDYEASSKLKSALQLKAAQQKSRWKTESSKHVTNNLPSENDIMKTPTISRPYDLPVKPNQHPSTLPKNHQMNYKAENKILQTTNPKMPYLTPNVPVHQWNPRPVPTISPLHVLRHNLSSSIPNSKPVKAKQGKNKNKFPTGSSKHIPDLYDDPISSASVDVLGKARKVGKGSAGDKVNKQAYIAVTVYKPPNKETFRKIDLPPKHNNIPSRFQHEPLPFHKASKTYPIGKPAVTILTTGGRDSHPGHHPYKNKANKPVALFDNSVLKVGKAAKSKMKMKNKGGFGGKSKSKHPGKWKFKSNMDTDEMEAQLMALSMMEKKLKQHLMQKERLRQRLRMHHHGMRMPRGADAYM